VKDMRQFVGPIPSKALDGCMTCGAMNSVETPVIQLRLGRAGGAFIARVCIHCLQGMAGAAVQMCADALVNGHHCSMEFIGVDGSMNLQHGEVYACRLRRGNEQERGRGWKYVLMVNGSVKCPYSSAGAFFENWKVKEVLGGSGNG
jgi:hypothetical protein